MGYERRDARFKLFEAHFGRRYSIERSRISVSTKSANQF